MEVIPTILLATHGMECHQQSCQCLVALGQLQSLDGEPVEQSSEILALFREP
jgi:hypothetical protein